MAPLVELPTWIFIATGIETLAKTPDLSHLNHRSATTTTFEVIAVQNTSRFLRPAQSTATGAPIPGGATMVKSARDLRMIKAAYGTCQKLVLGDFDVGTVEEKTQVSGLVFVYDTDFEGILKDMKWKSYPVWVYQQCSDSWLRTLFPGTRVLPATTTGFDMKGYKSPALNSAEAARILRNNGGVEYAAAVMVVNRSTTSIRSGFAVEFGSEEDLEQIRKWGWAAKRQTLVEAHLKIEGVGAVMGKNFVFSGEASELLVPKTIQDTMRGLPHVFGRV